MGEVGWPLGSPAVTGDELEIFDPEFPEGTTNVAARIVVRRRPSLTGAFSAPVVLHEFDGLCDPSGDSTTLDVSADGLRLYVACVSEGGGPLYRATRQTRSAPFVLSTAPVGIVGFFVALSVDELSAWSQNPQGKGMYMYRRSRIDESFDGGQPVPGLTEQQLSGPEPTPDGLGLLGAILLPSGEQGLTLARRASTGSPFSSPEVRGLPVPPPMTSDSGPSISTDCRRLYFVRLGAAPSETRSTMVAQR